MLYMKLDVIVTSTIKLALRCRELNTDFDVETIHLVTTLASASSKCNEKHD
jgi:hypothetical protein